ncbi:ATP-dependent DNA helicase [Nocardioides bizhenqiangii]|uniref:DNA 3'-5' helicase n=1 Tax=Nocardioides bizhenqiangii TaxID=3095076 RepID=A0ABZ0ZMY5_9ACTN|nr:ATP-dependent DNA helicase [Nocardioides sp. HM61]WQQ25425.1 ATP-dependent DNA helicase [Nocardioides sp. HM61]
MNVDTPAQLAALMGHDWLYSEEQFAAITADLEPAVVIAGAGSGKTAVMAARVVWLVATGQVAPGEVLGLTFTTKATAELQHRIRSSLLQAGLLPERGPRLLAPDETDVEEDAEEPTVATYHAYAAALLSEHGLRIGHEPDTRLIADASRYQLAARAIQRHQRPIGLLTDSPTHAVRYLLALDAEMAEHLVSPDEVRAYDAAERPRFAVELEALEAQLAEGKRVKGKSDLVRDAIAAIDKRAELLGLVDDYRALKARLGLMDFSDQIALAGRLARDCPEVGAIERGKFKVVLLDEYQDTSVAQATMLSRIFGDGHPVTAVGDPNQAIYGWRGASVSNIQEFGRDFPTVDGRRPSYSLTVNRRSDARILATANHLARELYAGREHDRLRPDDGVADGEVRVAVHETSDDELAWLADQVLAAHDQVPWKEIGVLTRDNASAALVFDALTDREIPVEIVGLKGLLRLPEVAEVVATLELVQDVTANPALLTLLAGPRWAIGVRDLALLGRRSGELVGQQGQQSFADLESQLAAAVEGADPLEIPSLCDALEDPGDLDYSPEARARFALLAEELRVLRRSIGEPILDLVRRIIDVNGIDVELASSVSPAAAARRENLDLFVQAVADFQAIDGQVTLPALLAWLDAEDEFGQGLDVATPSEADSVKLLTVHRAKGLEWDAVFLVGVVKDRFPANRGRSSWLKSPEVMPAALRGDSVDLPQLAGHDADAITDLKERRKRHQQVEELRLAYVAWTRARHHHAVSCWRWAPHLKGGLGPSPYVVDTHDAIETWGGVPERWADVVEKGEPNPYADRSVDLPWPILHHTQEVDRRLAAAELVRTAEDPMLDDVLLLEQVQQWDDEIARLLDEAARERAPETEVPMPTSISATALARLRDDPAAFAADRARPMPRQPSPAARFGTRFHAWVEARFGQQELFDPDDLPGRADAGIEDDEALKEVIAAFEAGPFATRPPFQIEAPFALVLAGQVVRGRIDAVYDEGDGRYLVVDWKTNTSQTADPLQLALYRLAWAELRGVALEQVRAAFYYVRSGELVEPDDLPGRAELERLVTPARP